MVISSHYRRPQPNMLANIFSYFHCRRIIGIFGTIENNTEGLVHISIFRVEGGSEVVPGSPGTTLDECDHMSFLCLTCYDPWIYTASHACPGLYTGKHCRATIMHEVLTIFG